MKYLFQPGNDVDNSGGNDFRLSNADCRFPAPDLDVAPASRRLSGGRLARPKRIDGMLEVHSLKLFF